MRANDCPHGRVEAPLTAFERSRDGYLPAMHAGIWFVVNGLAIQLRGFIVARRHCTHRERLRISDAVSDRVATGAIERSPSLAEPDALLDA